MANLSTTLTFDSFDLAEGGESRLANGYGGFNWQQAGIYNPNGAIAGYVPSSGQNILFIAEAANNEVAGYEDAAAGSALVMSRETPFTLDTIQLSSAFRDGLTVTIRAYADQAGTILIGEKTVTVDTAAQSLVSFADDGLDYGTFSGATRIEFNANDNNAGTNDYFGIDNLTYHDTPPTFTLDFDDIALAPAQRRRLARIRASHLPKPVPTTSMARFQAIPPPRAPTSASLPKPTTTKWLATKARQPVRRW